MTGTRTTAADRRERAFRGPFADGPPPEALRVDPPPLEHLRMAELRRLVMVVVVLGWSVPASIAARSLRRRRATLAEAACEGLIDGFFRLGPTLVKAGQIIASSAVVFPPVLGKAARRCLDAVPPFPVDHVHRTIEEDLGHPVGVLFASFDDTPLSAASIGQVHACTLADGRDAVVKVQRPGIPELMATDLRIGYMLAWLVEKTPWGRRSNARAVIRDIHGITFQELNPAREAWQQHRFRANIDAFGDNEMITAPEVYWDYCGPRVICMERVYGIPMDHFDEMQNRGIDGQTILRRGAKAWAESVMVHGPYHADLHAGNMWVLDDGRGCYLDFGIMGELPDEWKQFIKDLFYTCEFDLDFTRIAHALRSVGAIPPDMGTDEELAAVLEQLIGPVLADGFGGIDLPQLIGQSIELLKVYDAYAPRELILIAKQLLYVDKYTKYLAPDYSLTADPYIVKNVFPVEAAQLADDLGIDLDDDTMLPTRTAATTTPTAIVNADRASTRVAGSVQYPFLSPEWMAAVRRIRDEFADQPLPVDVPAIAANLTVTDVPFGDGTIHAHATNARGPIEIELGRLPEVPLNVTLDHETARTLVIEQRPEEAMRAFLVGKIQLDGDLSNALGEGINPMALLTSFNITGSTTLADLDPTAAIIGERIRALTA